MTYPMSEINMYNANAPCGLFHHGCVFDLGLPMRPRRQAWSAGQSCPNQRKGY
jgi:hypothetical protein